MTVEPTEQQYGIVTRRNTIQIFAAVGVNLLQFNAQS
jgi:hypothetical protein